MLNEITRKVNLSLADIGRLIHILNIEINNHKIRIINIDRSGQTTLASRAERNDLIRQVDELTALQHKLIYHRSYEVQNNDNEENKT